MRAEEASSLEWVQEHSQQLGTRAGQHESQRMAGGGWGVREDRKRYKQQHSEDPEVSSSTCRRRAKHSQKKRDDVLLVLSTLCNQVSYGSEKKRSSSAVKRHELDFHRVNSLCNRNEPGLKVSSVVHRQQAANQPANQPGQPTSQLISHPSETHRLRDRYPTVKRPQ